MSENNNNNNTLIEDQNKNQSQQSQQQQERKSSANIEVKVLTQEEINQRRIDLIEQSRANRRLDNTGNPEHWGKLKEKQELDPTTGHNRQIQLTDEQKKNLKQTKKERKKLKKALEQKFKALQGLPVNGGHEDRSLQNQEGQQRMGKRKFKEMYIEKMKNAPRVVVDFQFLDQTPAQKDLISLLRQVEVCHHENKNVEKPLKLTCAQGNHELIQKYKDIRCAQNWGIEFEPRDILDAYDKKDLVYMSGDVDVELGEYDPTKTYIIGGLVEHNRLVNLTKDYCEKNNIVARKLPLNRYINMKACPLLNINHVFMMFLRLHNGESMEKAIVKSVPKRKIGNTHFTDSEEDSDQEEKKNNNNQQKQQQQQQEQNQEKSTENK